MRALLGLLISACKGKGRGQVFSPSGSCLPSLPSPGTTACPPQDTDYWSSRRALLRSGSCFHSFCVNLRVFSPKTEHETTPQRDRKPSLLNQRIILNPRITINFFSFKTGFCVRDEIEDNIKIEMYIILFTFDFLFLGSLF